MYIDIYIYNLVYIYISREMKRDRDIEREWFRHRRGRVRGGIYRERE